MQWARSPPRRFLRHSHGKRIARFGLVYALGNDRKYKIVSNWQLSAVMWCRPSSRLGMAVSAVIISEACHGISTASHAIRSDLGHLLRHLG